MRNKSEFSENDINRNLGIILIERKLDYLFPPARHVSKEYYVLYRFDRNSEGVGNFYAISVKI